MSEKNGFELRKEKKMQDIELAAVHLLNTKSLSDITMNEIAKTAGAGKVTLFNYYDSKDNLLSTSIRNAFADVHEHYQEIIHSPISFEETYKDITNFKMSKLNQMTPLFFKNMVEIYKNDPSFLNPQTLLKMDEIYLSLFAKGRREGKINPAYSDQLLLSLMHIYTEGLRAVNWEEIEDVERFSNQLTQIFMNSMR